MALSDAPLRQRDPQGQDTVDGVASHQIVSVYLINHLLPETRPGVRSSIDMADINEVPVVFNWATPAWSLSAEGFSISSQRHDPPPALYFPDVGPLPTSNELHPLAQPGECATDT
jgi:hypothetical protein